MPPAWDAGAPNLESPAAQNGQSLEKTTKFAPRNVLAITTCHLDVRAVVEILHVLRSDEEQFAVLHDLTAKNPRMENVSRSDRAVL